MATENAIGNFKFFRLSPPPDLNRRRLIAEARAGLNGHEVWIDAQRGSAQQVSTVSDTSDFEATSNAYNNAIGDVVKVTYDGVERPGSYIIMDVVSHKRPLLFGRQEHASADPNAIIEAQWVLLYHFE